MADRTDAELDFINENARRLLAEVWAEEQARTGAVQSEVLEPYRTAAVDKGWVSVKGAVPKVLAKGFSAAAAYLRR
jgi:hypothetical protein